MENRYSDWDRECLIKEIEKLKKRFGIVFEQKIEDVVELCKGNIPFLVKDSSRFIKPENGKPTSILIEGENYHALSVLNYTHRNKIDIIYIDPPYNTGSEDWKYNNNYIDNNDAYKHTTWLNFMEHRLLLAKNLLTENGVLICTIDRYELFELGMLLKKLFPSKGITCVTIVHNPSGTQGLNFSHNNEYALFVYKKEIKTIEAETRDSSNADVRQFMNTAKGNTDNYLRAPGTNTFYPILVKDHKIVGFGDVCDDNFHPESSNVVLEDGTIEIYPIDNDGVERKWVFARGTVESIFDDLSVKFEKNKKKYVIIRTKKNINYKTHWDSEMFCAKKYGKQLLREIVESEFEYPKSLYAVEECLKAVRHDKDNAIILDFFAGSGTTAQAVLDLNKADGGSRQIIACTNNENKICEEVTFPRIQKVSQGYFPLCNSVQRKNVKKDSYLDFDIDFDNMSSKHRKRQEERKWVDGLGGGLVSFTIGFLEAAAITDDVKVEFASKSIDIVCLKENCFEEVASKEFCRIYKNDSGKYLGVIYDSDKNEDMVSVKFLIDFIKKTKKKFVVYMFSYSTSVSYDCFEEVLDLVEVNPFPCPLINIYERLHKK